MAKVLIERRSPESAGDYEPTGMHFDGTEVEISAHIAEIKARDGWDYRAAPVPVENDPPSQE